MRLFLAVDVPVQVGEQLEGQLSVLRKEYAQFNWVPKENFHITVVFLGEVENKGEIEKIKHKVSDALFDINSFVLYSFGADLFITDKILLYVSFRREKALEEIALKIKNNLQLEDSKKYIPHLSIARTRVPSKQQYLHLKKKLLKLPIDISFPVKKIHLFESIQDGKKPIYKKIASFTLSKS